MFFTFENKKFFKIMMDFETLKTFKVDWDKGKRMNQKNLPDLKGS